MAEGKRPVPFRTRKLSPPALMVLHPPGCGRVRHRRHTHNSVPPKTDVLGGTLFCGPATPPCGSAMVRTRVMGVSGSTEQTKLSLKPRSAEVTEGLERTAARGMLR